MAGSKYFKANSTEAGAVAAGENSVAIGPNAVANGVNSVAIGNGAIADADNSVALGAGSIADRANTISVGSTGHERQITNVAAGTAPTDAVNVSQLRDVSNEITGVKHGVASAMAMQMPTLNVPGRVVLHTGIAHYDGATAYALTGKYTSVTNRWNLGAGIGVSGGKVGATVGADFVMDWGHDYHDGYSQTQLVPVVPAGGTMNIPTDVPSKSPPY